MPERSVNRDTVRVPCIRKCASQQTLADGLAGWVSEYVASALTTQHGISDTELAIFGPAEEIGLRSVISSIFCVMND
jgi:hypothetical protein